MFGVVVARTGGVLTPVELPVNPPGLVLTLFLGKDGQIMPAKCDEATKVKAIRLVADHRDDYDSEWAAISAVSARLGMTAETLRKWIRQAAVDTGEVEGVSTEAARAIRVRDRKIAELEQTIEILKAATSFFARESDPRHR